MLKRLLMGVPFALAIAVAIALPARATTVLPQALDAITGTAAVAFEGKCAANRTVRDPATGLIVTYTTFNVSDVLKGTAGATYTIKQLGGELADEHIGMRLVGVPIFTVGQDYVVFMAGVSRSGFSSPIGLSQGRFVVQDTPSGRTVANGRDFREMAADIPEAELPAGLAQRLKHTAAPVHEFDLADFKRLVRSRPGAVNR